MGHRGAGPEGDLTRTRDLAPLDRRVVARRRGRATEIEAVAGRADVDRVNARATHPGDVRAAQLETNVFGVLDKDILDHKIVHPENDEAALGARALVGLSPALVIECQPLGGEA